MMVLTQKFYCIFPYHHTTTGENLKMIVYFSLELWFFKVVKLDVCGRLVLSHSVTYITAVNHSVSAIYCVGIFITTSLD